MSHTPPPARLGFLYPGHAAEDDYPLMGSMIEPPAQITLIHTEFLEDAHTVEALDNVMCGVAVARRGWCGPGDILNTLPREEFLAHLDLQKPQRAQVFAGHG